MAMLKCVLDTYKQLKTSFTCQNITYFIKHSSLLTTYGFTSLLSILEVLVLLDFEATMSDELTVHVGDVVKNVSKGKEEGWLEGELRGKRGMFPSNFVKVCTCQSTLSIDFLVAINGHFQNGYFLLTGSACLLNRGQQQRAKKHEEM